MGMVITFYDAGDKYGTGSMDASAALAASNNARVGTALTSTNSWTGSLQIGQPVSVSQTYSGGFTTKLSFVYTTATTGTLSDLSVYWTATNELLYRTTGSVPFSVSTFETDIQEQNILSGNDTINGSSGDNDLIGYGGNDRIDGGGGIDTVYFRGFKSQYTVQKSGTALQVSGPDGIDTLLNVERLHFDDTTLSFDTTGHSAQAYRLYQAAFNRTPDQTGLGWQIKAMDSGTSLEQVSQNFINSTEFKSLYGTTPSNTQLVTLLYNNVLHRTPQQAEVDFWVGILDGTNPNSHQTSAQVLMNFSESAENQAQVVGTLQAGFNYTTY
jgi:Ca2+-binding RTX toxin-like protein